MRINNANDKNNTLMTTQTVKRVILKVSYNRTITMNENKVILTHDKQRPLHGREE